MDTKEVRLWVNNAYLFMFDCQILAAGRQLSKIPLFSSMNVTQMRMHTNY